ncbi:MAG: hypothetical protein HGA62_06390, partial [Chlorobiaceae bacterium]|nr:hypothetical protein [Chlorobiaceae bacterium]
AFALRNLQAQVFLPTVTVFVWNFGRVLLRSGLSKFVNLSHTLKDEDDHTFEFMVREAGDKWLFCSRTGSGDATKNLQV